MPLLPGPGQTAPVRCPLLLDKKVLGWREGAGRCKARAQSTPEGVRLDAGKHQGQGTLHAREQAQDAAGGGAPGAGLLLRGPGSSRPLSVCLRAAAPGPLVSIQDTGAVQLPPVGPALGCQPPGGSLLALWACRGGQMGRPQGRAASGPACGPGGRVPREHRGGGCRPGQGLATGPRWQG